MKILKHKSKSLPYRVVAPVGFDGEGVRKNLYFPNKPLAEAAAARIKRWKIERKNPATHNVELPPEDVAIALAIKQKLEGDWKLFDEIYAHWRKTGEGAIYKTTVLDAAEQYIAWREGSEKSKRTTSDVRYRLNAFARAYGETQLHQIGAAELSAFLDTHTAGWQRKSFWKRLGGFMGWAKMQRLIAINPMLEMKPPAVDFAAPEIYSVEDMATILETCDTSFKDLLPFVAFSAFGFVRTSELVRMYKGEQVLNWSNVKWEEGKIHVPHGVAKLTKRKLGDERWIPAELAFGHWITGYGPVIGPFNSPIVPWQHNKFYARMEELFAAAEVEKIDNGFRHSCMSYFIAAKPEVGVALAASYAGNSESVARRHYIKQLKKEQGEAYWALRRN